MRGPAMPVGPTKDRSWPHRPTPDELADEVWEDESPAAGRHHDADETDHALRNLYPGSVASHGRVAHGDREPSTTNGDPPCAPSAA